MTTINTTLAIFDEATARLWGLAEIYPEQGILKEMAIDLEVARHCGSDLNILEDAEGVSQGLEAMIEFGHIELDDNSREVARDVIYDLYDVCTRINEGI